MNDLSLYYLSHHHFHPHPLVLLHHRPQVAVCPNAVVELAVWVRVAAESVLLAEPEAALVVAAVGVRDGALSFHHVALEHPPVLEGVNYEQISLSFCHVVMERSFVDLPAIFRSPLAVDQLVIDEISSVVHSL